MAEALTGARPALRGFFQGVIYSLLSFAFVRVLMVGWDVVAEWRVLLVLSSLVGFVFAIGHGIAGSVAGSLLGAIAGVFLGGAVSVLLPQWKVSYVVEERFEPGKEERFEPGKEFELKGPGLDGKTIDVKDYRGKILLVDFWATWCLPCVQELPNVRSTYEKYHADGFDVLAVSLDSEREELESFVQSRKLSWKQIFFEEKDKSGWKNPLAEQHGVRAIPATFLLDREGRVIATDLRGSELPRAVASQLGVLDGSQKQFRDVSITPYLSMLATSLALALLGATFQRQVMAHATSDS